MSEQLQAHFQGGEQTLPPVPVTARLSDRVHVALGMNPSPFSLRGTNTYIVGTGPKRILIDTGDAAFTEKYMPVLRRAMSEAGATGIEQIVVTHWHRDHIGGVPAVLAEYGRDIPVRKFRPPDSEQVWSGGTGEGAVSPEQALEGCNFVPLADGEVLRTEGATLRAIHTPGHANDHSVLVMEEERCMFTGDNVLGTGTPVFRDLPLYLRSLRRMHGERPAALYTSHGPAVADGVALIREYIAHRTARVEQIRAALPASGAGLTASEITRGIYTKHPERLIGPATGNTLQALRVLREEGAAECDLAPPRGANPYTGMAAPPAQLLRARWRRAAVAAVKSAL